LIQFDTMMTKNDRCQRLKRLKIIIIIQQWIWKNNTEN